MNKILLNTVAIDKNIIVNRGPNSTEGNNELKPCYFDITGVSPDMIL